VNSGHEDARVCVCIANYNGEKVIADCLRSVYEQDCDWPLQVIVHDDASNDSSRKIIRSQFPCARLIESPENIGFCKANNRMAAASDADYLLLLNNDAWLERDAISILVSAARRRGEAILTLPQLDAETGELEDCGMFMDLFANPIANKCIVEQAVATVMGSCLWVPRSLWQRCGGFPEWFQSIAEDMYLCNNARLLGYPIVALADSAYHHHVGHSFGGGKVIHGGLQTTYRRRRLSERNKTFVMMLFFPGPAVYLLLPLHLVALLLEGMLLALLKWDRAVFTRIYWFALSGFFSNFSMLWQKRRVLQRNRVIGILRYFSVFKWTPHKLRMLLRYGIPAIR